VVRSILGETATAPQSALIDTGADGTLVPSQLLDTIRADELHHTRLRSLWGEARMVRIFLVDLQIGDQVLPSVEVVADDAGSEILLGRNVLNSLILLLDGVHEQTDLLTRRPVRL
jgi:predicted aspartyl protease